MPIIKSAKKALRQSLRKRVHNTAYKQKTKELIKEAKALVGQKKMAEAKKMIPNIYKALDKAAKKGVIKKNEASRRKSRLTRLLIKAPAKETKK